MSFKSNRNVVYSCKSHVVFCPKYRRAVLMPPIDGRLKEIIEEVCADTGSGLIEMEVMPDHVHLLLECDPQIPAVHYAGLVLPLMLERKDKRGWQAAALAAPTKYV